MAVHGRFGQPGPTCGSPVQRIVYAENETNDCARSRLFKASWPRSIDELE